MRNSTSGKTDTRVFAKRGDVVNWKVHNGNKN
jgi:hypothetical protein